MASEAQSSQVDRFSPRRACLAMTGLVVIDEVQRRPDLMPQLRVLLARDPLPAQFLLLGSALPELVRGAINEAPLSAALPTQ